MSPNSRSDWFIDPSSPHLDSNVFRATLNNDKLQLSVSFLTSGSTRVRISPSKPESFNRYDVSTESTIISQEALASLLKPTIEVASSSVSVTSEKVTVTIQFKPFLITHFDASTNLRTILNDDENAVYETAMSKEDNPEPFEPHTFSGHTDNFKNGPNSVGMSFTFVSTKSDKVRISGLPSHTLPLTLSTESPIRLFNTDINRFEVNSPMAMYGSVPFIVAHTKSDASSLFWLNPSETWVTVKNSENQSKVRFISESGFLDFFIAHDVNSKPLMDKYTQLTGRPHLTPLFSLGLHQCRWGYLTQDEVMKVSTSLDEIQIPHDVLWLDLDYTDDRKYFTSHPSNFPSLQKLSSFLEKNSRNLVMLIDPHLKAQSSYSVYESARSGGYLIKTAENTDYAANCWPGRSSWPDFLNPEARHFFASLYQSKDFPVFNNLNTFVWNDMNEIAVFDSVDLTAPKDLLHYNGHEEREVHNIYGHLMTSATFQGLQKPQKRPFILTRSFFAGTQKFATVWTGDNQADWEHLKNSVQMVLSNGLAGIVYIGADVGGFFDSPDSKLLSRWYQVGAWTYSFFRIHCHHLSDYRELYILKGRDRELARDSVYDRYKLIYHWYTLARETSDTGVPLVRPIWMEFDGEEFQDEDESVMLGDGLFIVPLMNETVSEKSVNLPDADNERWFNWKGLSEVKGKGKVTDNEGVSVYLRGGKVIPVKERVRKSADLMFWDPFVLVCGLDKEGKSNGKVYVDDGRGYGYENGEKVFVGFEVDQSAGIWSKAIEVDATNDWVKKYDVTIEEIRIAGMDRVPREIIGDDGETRVFEVIDGILYIKRLRLRVSEEWKLSFNY